MTKPIFQTGTGDKNGSSVLRHLLGSPGMWSIVFVIIAAWMAHHYLGAIGGAEALRERFGMTAIVPLIVVHGLVSVSPLPGELVALANSMVFGFTLGVVSNWSGWMLAAIIQYGLVRRTASDLNLEQSSLWKRVPTWLQSVPVHHPFFLIGARWLPFGGHLVNTAAGAAAVPLWRHFWCSAISILPIAIIVAALGSAAAKALSVD